MSLIELSIFILIFAIGLTSFFFNLSSILKNLTTSKSALLANELALQRMEMILATRRINGFDQISDPCLTNPSFNVCLMPFGFHPAQVSISPDPNGISKTIQIQITGRGSSKLEMQVWPDQ